jgi:hypothetical protein
MTTNEPRLRVAQPSDSAFATDLYADFQPGPAKGAELEPYRPPAAPVVAPTIPTVVQQPGQQPYYAHVPAVIPAGPDIKSQRMMGCGVMAFGIGAGAGLAEAGSYLFFAGMSLATHAIVGVAAVVVSGAICLLLVKSAAGVRVGHLSVGDGANVQIGSR